VAASIAITCASPSHKNSVRLHRHHGFTISGVSAETGRCGSIYLARRAVNSEVPVCNGEVQNAFTGAVSGLKAWFHGVEGNKLLDTAYMSGRIS